MLDLFDLGFLLGLDVPGVTHTPPIAETEAEVENAEDQGMALFGLGVLLGLQLGQGGAPIMGLQNVARFPRPRTQSQVGRRGPEAPG